MLGNGQQRRALSSWNLLMDKIPSRVLSLGLVLTMSVLMLSCSQGTYKVDYFKEMHYSQASRMQEPPNLELPRLAVPVTGSEAPVSELATQDNPIHIEEFSKEQGEELYQRNCAMCHGIRADGQSFVADLIREAKANPPPPLTSSPLVQTASDGAIFAILTNGIVVMPPFRTLLSEEDRWILVHYLKSISDG